MITGQINADREAVIPLVLRSAAGQEMLLEAVIDTGFTDFLTLPPTLIASLQLPFREAVEFTLADGNVVAFETYTATVVWDGQEKNAFVLSSDGGPLVGMSLLYGYRVILDVIDGGLVTVEARP